MSGTAYHILTIPEDPIQRAATGRGRPVACPAPLADTPDRVRALPYVTGARYWGTVSGRERIYIDTEKRNGGVRWNGGLGYRTLYLDLHGGRLVCQSEAGAATRKILADTIDALGEIAADLTGRVRIDTEVVTP